MTEHPNDQNTAVPPPSARPVFTELPAFPPAPAPPSPFVGREREQARALQLLAERGVVALTGAHGSGKTALAAALCWASGSASFWIELASGLNDTVQPLLWQLARPLAHLAPNVWHTLHQVEQARWNYPPIVRLQIILDAYARQQQEILLCIDRLERIAEPALASLITGLCDYVARTHATRLKLIMVGTALPYQVLHWALPALQGLAPEALQRWANERSVNLSWPAAEQLARQTGGLPQPTRLLLDAIERTHDESTTNNIMAQPEVRQYVSWLLADLTPDQRSMLEQLTLQATVPSTFSRDQLIALEDSHLATLTGGTVVIHPLIRNFHQCYRFNR